MWRASPQFVLSARGVQPPNLPGLPAVLQLPPAAPTLCLWAGYLNDLCGIRGHVAECFRKAAGSAHVTAAKVASLAVDLVTAPIFEHEDQLSDRLLRPFLDDDVGNAFADQILQVLETHRLSLQMRVYRLHWGRGALRVHAGSAVSSSSWSRQVSSITGTGPSAYAVTMTSE